MRTLIKATLVIAASAALFACKPKPAANDELPTLADAEEESTEEAAAPSIDRVDACSITMTAPESADWTTYWSAAGGAGSEAHSVHWGDATEKEAQAKNNAVVPLQITCASNESPSVSISLTAPGSTEADIPLSGGTYPIWGKQQAPSLKGGQILMANLTFDNRTFDSRNGTLTISRFDMEGVAGSFTIDGNEMNEEAAPIHIEGTFDIPCTAAQMESACEANRRE